MRQLAGERGGVPGLVQKKGLESPANLLRLAPDDSAANRPLRFVGVRLPPELSPFFQTHSDLPRELPFRRAGLPEGNGCRFEFWNRTPFENRPLG